MDLETLHSRIEQMERELDNIRGELRVCKISVENELEKRHIKLENKVNNNNDDLKLLQKIVFTVIGVVTMAALYAGLRTIGL